MMSAQAAMDGVHGLQREGLDSMSDAEKETIHRLASAASGAIAMLDDASFVAHMQALCAAYKAYTAMCRGRGWTSARDAAALRDCGAPVAESEQLAMPSKPRGLGLCRAALRGG